VTATAPQTAFYYERFRALAGTDLVTYAEPFLTDPSAVVPPEALRRVAAELGAYDDYHLVYGIELGMEWLAAVFTAQIVRFLSHESLSVRLAVHRRLSHLPPSMVTDSLVEACERAVTGGSRFPDVSDIVEVLRRRQRPET
jgi:hypothetical protein